MLNPEGNLIKENLQITKDLVQFAKANNYKISLKSGDYNKSGFKKTRDPYNLDLLSQVHNLYISGNFYIKDYLDVICFNSVSVFMQVLKKHNLQIPTLKQIHALYKDNIKKTITTNSIEKFGVEHHLKSPEVRDKIKQTVRSVYGVDHIAHSEIVKSKTRNTVRSRYNVDHISQSVEIQNKARVTCVERYGVAKPFQSSEIQSKIKDSNIQNYGVYNPMQVPDISRKSQNNKVSNDPRAQELKRCYEIIDSADCSQKNDIFEFVTGEFAGTARLKHLRNLGLKDEKYSEPENFLKHILKDLRSGFVHNAKKAHGVKKLNDEYYEMDFYYPDLKLGIEVNGLGYHSTNADPFGNPKPKDYHFRKFQAFHKSGILMLSFTDYELYKFKDDVVNIIKHHLNLLDGTVSETIHVSEEFLRFNQIKSLEESLNYGLFDDNRLSEDFKNHQHQRFINEYEYWDNGIVGVIK